MTENIRGHHEEGLRLFLAGRTAESIAFFEAALKEQETSIRWNDWATAVLACGRQAEAEQGYRRALALDPENGQASVNLGVLLMRQKRIPEAVPFLERGRASVTADQRQVLDNLLESCRAQLLCTTQPPPAKSLLEAFGHRDLAGIFNDWTPVQITDPSLSWLNPPSPQFLAYVREHERLPFDDIPPDEANYLKPPTFRIAQAHRIWLTLETLRRYLDITARATILDLGAFPFTIDLAIREFLGASCPILASLNQTIPEDWSLWLRKRDIRLTWTNLDPLVVPNEQISQMSSTIQAGDCTIGTVIFAHVIEHLYHPLQILKEAYRVLAPGGKILLSTDNTFMAQALLTFLSLGEYLHEPAQGTAAMSFNAWRGHVRFFSAGDLRTLIEAAGFELVETQFEEVIYNSFVDEYFRNPTRSIPRWRADLLTLCPGYRNEIIMVGRKP
ncbi:MAG: methyltransferase domain-containing protein [Terriglobia bacterium]